MPSRNSHHKTVIIGGGSDGISVAARLISAGESDVAVIDPAEVHYYQPLRTLAGGGLARATSPTWSLRRAHRPGSRLGCPPTPANPGGYVQTGKATMRHARYGNVLRLGDAGSSPNSKTGAAIRKQAPVVVKNLRAVMAGREPAGAYDGYAS